MNLQTKAYIVAILGLLQLLDVATTALGLRRGAASSRALSSTTAAGWRRWRPRLRHWRAGAMATERQYTYRGDHLTRPELRGARCSAVLRADGRCVCSRLGTMLVRMESGEVVNVLRRCLRTMKEDRFNER
jgi:hypothetical protein